MIGMDSQQASNATLPTGSSSVAARMLHRKSQIGAADQLKRESSVETRKIQQMSGSNKLTNRDATSGRNQKSQILNLSMDSQKNGGGVTDALEFKPTSMFSLNGAKAMG